MVNCSKETRVKKSKPQDIPYNIIPQRWGREGWPWVPEHPVMPLCRVLRKKGKYTEREGSSKFILHNEEMPSTANREHCRKVVVVLRFCPIRNALKLSTGSISFITLSNEQIYETLRLPELAHMMPSQGQGWAYSMKQKCEAFFKSGCKHRPHF